MKRLSPKTWHWVRFATALAVVSVVAIGGSMLIASAVGATQNECNYRIQRGDTLSRIAARHGTTYQQLATRNGIADPNRIYVGDYIDICQPGPVPVAANRPVEVPGRAIDWAQAVTDTAPADATANEIRWLTALAGPESNWCRSNFNPRDAGPGGWQGSWGCPQIRTSTNWEARGEPWRNLQWLQQPGHNQEAEAAWIVLRAPGWGGLHNWGPARNTPNQLKLAEDCNRVRSNRRDACRSYWQIADLALANID